MTMCGVDGGIILGCKNILTTRSVCLTGTHGFTCNRGGVDGRTFHTFSFRRGKSR